MFEWIEINLMAIERGSWQENFCNWLKYVHSVCVVVRFSSFFRCCCWFGRVVRDHIQHFTSEEATLKSDNESQKPCSFPIKTWHYLPAYWIELWVSVWYCALKGFLRNEAREKIYIYKTINVPTTALQVATIYHENHLCHKNTHTHICITLNVYKQHIFPRKKKKYSTHLESNMRYVLKYRMCLHGIYSWLLYRWVFMCFSRFTFHRISTRKQRVHGANMLYRVYCIESGKKEIKKYNDCIVKLEFDFILMWKCFVQKTCEHVAFSWS